MTPPTDDRLGQLLDGKYRIVRLLGEGGMGAVYEARHELIGRRFAIKFLHPNMALNAEILMRFRREAQAAGALENENIAAVTDFGQSADGSPYIVMEFLVGEDLSRLLRGVGPLPLARAAQALLQACRGLLAAHAQGIVHRDLKPENLFVVQHGDGSDLIKVLDFGIAKLKHAGEGSSSTRTGATMGTPYYMPREQARGQKDIDGRADIYALGVIMYELLSGQKPYQGDSYNEIMFRILTTTPPPLAAFRPDLPPELVALVERAMAPEAAERFQSVSELMAALRPFAASRESQPGPARGSLPGAAVHAQSSMPSQVIGTAPGASATVPTAISAPRRSAWPAIALSALALGAGLTAITLRAGREQAAPVALASVVSMAAPVESVPAPPPAASERAASTELLRVAAPPQPEPPVAPAPHASAPHASAPVSRPQPARVIHQRVGVPAADPFAP